MPTYNPHPLLATPTSLRSDLTFARSVSLRNMITNENRSIEGSDVTYVRTEDLETVPASEGGDDPGEGGRTASKVSTIDIRIAGVSEIPKSGLIADGGRLYKHKVIKH
jgi:hypothetical protein